MLLTNLIKFGSPAQSDQKTGSVTASPMEALARTTRAPAGGDQYEFMGTSNRTVTSPMNLTPNFSGTAMFLTGDEPKRQIGGR
jgi:hypothetical protein